MKEQYHRAVSQIHVPSELLLMTKQAMKEEEERLSGQNRKTKVISFQTLSLVAAAILAVVIVVPMTAGLFSTEKEAEMTKPGMQLAGVQQSELAPIAKGGEAQEQVLTITKADSAPEKWTDSEEIIVAGKQILIAADENTGFFMAYDAEEGLLITSEVSEKEAFLKALENEL